MSFDPVWVDTLPYSGVEVRRADLMSAMGNGSVLGARSGVRPGDPGLTTSLSGSTINVSAGVAGIYQSGNGLYRACLAGGWSGTLTAADATYTRIDLVYLRVWDTDVDSSGLRQADVVYLAGTPSATPATPTPSGTVIYVPLATITVPPSGGGAASVSTAIRPYTVAPGGILPATTAPSSPYTGQYYDDGTRLWRYNGSAWKSQSPALPVVADQASSPASYASGSFTDFTITQWPHVSVTVPPSGMVAISIGAAVRNTVSSSSTGWVGWRSTGAIVEAASEANGVSCVGGRTYATRRVIRSGLTPGATLNLVAQYQFSVVNASTAITAVTDGQLIAEPIAG